MPPASSPATPTAVYVAAVPLRAPKGPAQGLMSAGYSLGLWDLQHFMVLLRPDPARAQALVFDFQPRDPEDALAALAVLSRSEMPGVVRRRTLRRVPDRRCWLVGHCCGGDAVGAADRFSERWPTGLVVGEHDCRDYTNGLVEVLTGEKRVLEVLRSGASGAAPPWCECLSLFSCSFLDLPSRGALASSVCVVCTESRSRYETSFVPSKRYEISFPIPGDVACA